MKKTIIFIIIAIIIFLVAVFIIANNRNSEVAPSPNSSGTRLSTNVNEEQSKDKTANLIANQYEKDATQTEISAFATDILDDAPARLNNISITCSILNDTIVEAGQTFSFNELVGKPTAERGYQEAKVIIDHEAELGIGGGNCQVSSTLFDAVKAIPGLVIVERHEHGKPVGYVPLGEDATVSYGSFDFKFRNELGYDIRINASTDNQAVTIRLFKV